MLLTVFGIKAAVFPLAAWLPDSYPTAPAPVTAVFAGPADQGRRLLHASAPRPCSSPATGSATCSWSSPLASMIVGILGAVAQTDLKRLLSFTLISHIGYMVFGIGLADRAGIGGADLLRRPPHHRADHAVPRRRADRTPGRHHAS